MLKLRALGALIAVVVITLLLSNYLLQFWVRAFVSGPEPTWHWGSPAWLTMTWGWNLLVPFVASLLLAAMLPRTSKIWWYIALGVIYAALRFFAEGGFSGSGTDLRFTLWRYGSYLASVGGATLGGIVVMALHGSASPSNNRWRGP
jgi:hypothetical protein